jgi:hypothetical protein
MHDDEFSMTPLRPPDPASPEARPSAARPPRRLSGRLGAAGALTLLTLSLCALLLGAAHTGRPASIASARDALHAHDACWQHR